MIKCDYCDSEKDDVIYYDSYYVCRECYDNAVECKHCGELIFDEYHKNEEYCIDCL